MSAERTRTNGFREAGTPADPASPRTDGRSVPELVRELALEGRDLVQQELDLAKAEVREKLDHYRRGTAAMVVGGAFLLAGLLPLLWAVNMGLTALLGQWVDVATAVWLSPLILSLALLGIGFSLLQSGKSTIAEEGVIPQRTRATIEEDARWAREKAREMKEEAIHG